MSDRTMVLWCPDWPIAAAGAEFGDDPATPIALIEKGLVFACSAAARQAGVARGLKLREAQYRCPEILVREYDAALDARAFEPVIRTVEEIVPAVQLIRPGTLAMRSRGPSRYYGGEEQAAGVLLSTAAEAGVRDARIGIADGLLAAEQAARAAGRLTTDRFTGGPVVIVPPGESARFLASLPVRLVVEERTATLLHRLGVRTLGDFAALGADDVLRRFGPEGALAHARAGARDASQVTPRTPPPEYELSHDFEPPVDRVDQLAFALRAGAEEFIGRMRRVRLVCTGVRVEMHDERGGVSSRTWLHPRWFTPADVVDRVRWQLQGTGSAGAGLAAPIVRVRIVPERVDSTGNHETGLWGSGLDERVHHGLSRVQSMLGHEGVVTAQLGGGRLLADRQVFVPWGDKPPASTARRPWPGNLTGLVPATVYAERMPVRLVTATGESLLVDERGNLAGAPERFTTPERRERAIRAWAGPWPVVERWWDAERARRVHRFQLVDEEGSAWLLILDDGRWLAEARYD